MATNISTVYPKVLDSLLSAAWFQPRSCRGCTKTPGGTEVASPPALPILRMPHSTHPGQVSYNRCTSQWPRKRPSGQGEGAVAKGERDERRDKQGNPWHLVVPSGLATRY